MRMSAPRPRRHSSITTPRSFSISVESNEMPRAQSPRMSKAFPSMLEESVGNLELVDRLVEARRRVDVGPEPHSDGLEVAHELVLREPLGAVERHVLEEVRETALVIVLEHRSGVDDEPQLRAFLRLRVTPDVITNAVRQRADDDARVAWERRGAGGVNAGRHAVVGAADCPAAMDETANVEAATASTSTRRHEYASMACSRKGVS